MSSQQNSQNWQQGTNQYGNYYTHRGEGAAHGGNYHYSNQDGSYYYQNTNGSTFYQAPNGHRNYTAPENNPRNTQQ
ncbi:hypothetical protein I4U23_030597 [Adineta vaga]|nr:hypothetical protein I4U23_030597 [Adineta vaga]